MNNLPKRFQVFDEADRHLLRQHATEGNTAQPGPIRGFLSTQSDSAPAGPILSAQPVESGRAFRPRREDSARLGYSFDCDLPAFKPLMATGVFQNIPDGRGPFFRADYIRMPY